jgi:hypothetical protein
MIDLILQALRSALFGPKDYFERQKRRLLRWMLLPLFGAFVVPGIVMGVISQIGLLEISTEGKTFRLWGSTSYDMIVLVVGVSMMFVVALILNFSYGRHLAESMKDLAQTEEKVRRAAGYYVLRTQFFRELSAGGYREAAALADYIGQNFSDVMHADPEFMNAMLAVRLPSNRP